MAAAVTQPHWAHCPLELQLRPEAQLPQAPPQPSAPQALLEQLGVQATVAGKSAPVGMIAELPFGGVQDSLMRSPPPFW
jgi:hypothetical protein